MHENDSTVMALRNPLNGSHDVINLRETLVKRGIRIYLANKEEWTQLVTQLVDLSKHHQDQTGKILSIEWPQVELRRLRNQELRILEKFKAQRLGELPTRTMRQICPLAEKWTKIPLDHLSNQTIMMLTGLVTNEHHLLVKGELDLLLRMAIAFP